MDVAAAASWVLAGDRRPLFIAAALILPPSLRSRHPAAASP